MRHALKIWLFFFAVFSSGSLSMLFGPDALAAEARTTQGIEAVDRGGESSGQGIPVPSLKPQITLRPYTGQLGRHKTVYEDTLLKIARANNLGYVEIRAANPGIDPWLPGADQDIILPSQHILPRAPRQGIVINLAEMRLYAFLKISEEPVTYPIGIGRTGLKTPIGTTYVSSKKAHPTWFPTQRMREEDPSLPAAVGPGPDNPLGTHALYLDWPTFLIHGTSEPWGIGRRVSSGCIRLYPEDIKEIYPLIDEGMQVTIVDQPVKSGWINGRLYVEAHVSQKYANEMEETGQRPPLDVSGKDFKVILDQAGKYVGEIDWLRLREVLRERKGYPVAITPKIRRSLAPRTQTASVHSLGQEEQKE